MLKKNYEQLKKQFIDFFKDKYYLPIVKKEEASNIIYNTLSFNYIGYEETGVALFYRDKIKGNVWIMFFYTFKSLKRDQIINIEIKREKKRRIISDFSMQEQAFFYSNNIPMYCLFETEKTNKYFSNVLYFNEQTKELKIALKLDITGSKPEDFRLYYKKIN